MLVVVLTVLPLLQAFEDFSLAESTQVHCTPGEEIVLSVPFGGYGDEAWSLEVPSSAVELLDQSMVPHHSRQGLWGEQEFRLRCSATAPSNSAVTLHLVRTTGSLPIILSII